MTTVETRPFILAAALEEVARKGGLHCGQSSIRVYAAQC